jgi:hypothetical protein
LKGKPEALQNTVPTWLARFETPRHTAEVGIFLFRDIDSPPGTPLYWP